MAFIIYLLKQVQKMNFYLSDINLIKIYRQLVNLMQTIKVINQTLWRFHTIKYAFSQQSKSFQSGTFYKNSKQNSRNPSPQIINKLKSNFNYKYDKSRLMDPQFFAKLIDQQFSIQKCITVFASLAQRTISKPEFEKIFKKYNYFVYQSFLNIDKYYASQTTKQKPLTELQPRLQEVNIKFSFLNSITKIYQKNPGFQTQGQIKAFNKTVHELSTLETFENYLTFEQRVILIDCVLRYNTKKAQAIFIKSIKLLHKQIAHLTQETAIVFLNFMGKTKIIDNLLIQRSLDVLYPLIGDMGIQTISKVLFNLGTTQKFINKGFLIRIAKRFKQLTLSNKVSGFEMMNCISSISLIEKNMNASAPIDQIDEIYQFSIPQFLKYLPNMKQRQIQTLSNIIRRAKYYDVTVMTLIMEQCIKRQVLQLIQNEEKHKLVGVHRKYNSNRRSGAPTYIHLNGLISVLHMAAVCNFRYEPFMKYILSILKLADQLDLLQSDIKGRIIWSLCVLCDKAEVSTLYGIISKQLQYFNSENVQEVQKQMQRHDIMNFYYCYLYLKTFDSRITLNKQVFPRYLSKSHMNTVISEIHENVYSWFLQAGVACLKQFNISNLLVDIFIPQLIAQVNQEQVRVENVIVDVHGYHHFVRNGTTVEGGNQLKKKLLESQGYSYYYISIDEWNLVQQEDKLLFVKGYIANLIKNQVKKKKAKAIPKQLEKPQIQPKRDQLD